jgi:quercetin dioxygenase-like cupin family protein
MKVRAMEVNQCLHSEQTRRKPAMTSQFRISSEIKPELPDWGVLRWVCHPSTGAKQITVVDGTFAPGQGHSFHMHPDQEEVMYVVSGEVEQWLEQEKRILGPGDAIFIAAGVVHAVFNTGRGEARVVAVFGPSIGEGGMGVVELAGEAPWKGLRAAA